MTYNPKPNGSEAAKKALDRYFRGEHRFKKKEPDPPKSPSWTVVIIVGSLVVGVVISVVHGIIQLFK